jgi:hypothetical protein
MIGPAAVSTYVAFIARTNVMLTCSVATIHDFLRLDKPELVDDASFSELVRLTGTWELVNRFAMQQHL